MRALGAARLASLVAVLFASSASASVMEVHLVRSEDSDAPFQFVPDEVRASPGDTVRWVNDERVFHTVSHNPDASARRATDESEFDATLSREGESFEHTFDDAGTFHFFCKPHASFMVGRLVVGEGGAEDGTPAADGTPTAPLLMLVSGLAAAALVRRRG